MAKLTTHSEPAGIHRMAYDNNDGRLRGRKLQAARLRIWSADPHCAMCRKLVAYPYGFELDHKQALFKEGSNDDDNMQVLCGDCHDAKTNADLGHKPRVTIGADGWPIDDASKSAPVWKRKGYR